MGRNCRYGQMIWPYGAPSGERGNSRDLRHRIQGEVPEPVKALQARRATIRSWPPDAARRLPGCRRRWDPYGCMKGSVMLPPGVDLTDPVLEDIPEAESSEGPFF